ncbi:MAG: LCP family protein [Anaerolineales bacterium]|nr:LCP family protein [Anaerolineales bacterium]
MHTTTRKALLVVVFLAGLAVVALGVLAFPGLKRSWSAPLGPALSLPTYTASAATQAAVNSPLPTASLPVTAGQGMTLTQAARTPSPTSPPTPKPLCGGEAVAFILGIGADSGQDYAYGLADVIRVARVDFITPKITVLSIPRDLWVEIPDIEDHYGITHGKLNQAYFYGGEGMGYYRGHGGGPGLLARTLDLNFGLRVDHYGAVNMNTFVKIVDAVGGIDIHLPKDVDGRSEDPMTIDLGYFTAGQHHLSGEEALRLARVRKKYNDFTRQDNQTLVMCALRKKLEDPSILIKLPRLIAAFQDSVLTDLSPEQISQYACLLPYLKGENLMFTSLPDEIFSPGRVYNPRQKNTTFVMEADYDVIRDYVSDFIAGAWPTEKEESSCP